MNTDEIFKILYPIYIFSLFPNTGMTWQADLQNISQQWLTLCDLIDRGKFFNSLKKMCREYGLILEGYDLDTSFYHANNTWKGELLLEVVRRWIWFHDEDVPLDVIPASLVGSKIVIDTEICKTLTFNQISINLDDI